MASGNDELLDLRWDVCTDYSQLNSGDVRVTAFVFHSLFYACDKYFLLVV
jgi:hypothetical protein